MADTLFADHALTPVGWARDLRVRIESDGRIGALGGPREDGDRAVGVLLPAPANLHSHAFQRAMAGLAEARGPGGNDSFWTWRTLMYRFLDRLTPDDVEAISALVFMEMLEAGYASVGEFHYLHHAPGGAPYDDPAEMAARIAAAADATGIGLTLLPVLYTYGGADKRPVGSGQVRFACDLDRFLCLNDSAGKTLKQLPADARIGVAPHSLRAVDQEGLHFVEHSAPDGPIHIHVAEQMREVEDIETAFGARPVEWLMANAAVDDRWCLIHATHMTPDETLAVAGSGAVAGLCPITESNLGDGIFDGARFVLASGTFGVGSDSNVRISLSEELRTLEYSQRLQDRARAVLADDGRSTGRFLFDQICRGGAKAVARDTGAIETGRFADLVALDAGVLDLDGLSGDAILDAFIFAGDDRWVTDVWSAGRHVVTDGRHIHRERIVATARKIFKTLRATL